MLTRVIGTALIRKTLSINEDQVYDFIESNSLKSYTYGSRFTLISYTYFSSSYYDGGYYHCYEIPKPVIVPSARELPRNFLDSQAGGAVFLSRLMRKITVRLFSLFFLKLNVIAVKKESSQSFFLFEIGFSK